MPKFLQNLLKTVEISHGIIVHCRYFTHTPPRGVGGLRCFTGEAGDQTDTAASHGGDDVICIGRGQVLHLLGRQVLSAAAQPTEIRALNSGTAGT